MHKVPIFSKLNHLHTIITDANPTTSVTVQAKEQLEQERAGLRREVERLQEKFHAAHEKSIEAQARVAELLDRLERAESSSAVASQQAASVEVITKSKVRGGQGQRLVCPAVVGCACVE